MQKYSHYLSTHLPSEEEQQEFVGKHIKLLSLQQLKEVHALMTKDPLLTDVPPSADSETVSRYIAHESGRAVTIYLIKANGERLGM